MNIYTISDLHIDYEKNRLWLFNLSQSEYKKDIIIVAGDISSNLKLLENAFVLLKKCFKAVFFVLGNHELWVRGSEIEDSLAQIDEINKIALENGICMEAQDYDGFSILPINSWYDFSFGQPDKYLLEIWRDFKLCKFIRQYDFTVINSYFQEKNRRCIYDKDNKIITFSHFVPGLYLLPTFTNNLKILNPVMGSEYIQHYIKEMNSSIHIYGHIHLNQKRRIGNTVYINNAFGYPYEVNGVSKKLVKLTL